MWEAQRLESLMAVVVEDYWCLWEKDNGSLSVINHQMASFDSLERDFYLLQRKLMIRS